MKRPYQVSELNAASYFSTHSTFVAAQASARKAWKTASGRDTIVVLFYPEGGYQRKTEIVFQLDGTNPRVQLGGSVLSGGGDMREGT